MTKAGGCKTTVMTDKEIQILKECLDIVQDIVKSACARLAAMPSMGQMEVEGLASLILDKAPSRLEHNGMVGKPGNEIRAFLWKCAKGDVRNVYRKARRVLSRRAAVSEIERLACGSEEDFCESREDMARQAVHHLLDSAPHDVRLLCQVYMENGSFDAASAELGWSKGRIYRTKKAAENFFRKNCIFRGGFFELATFGR